jgi:hypothetical protein
MTLYVVTTGSYSDYSIHSIYSTREKAEAVVALLGDERLDCDNPAIKEYELDALTEGSVSEVFRVWIRKSDGDLVGTDSNCSIVQPRHTYVEMQREHIMADSVVSPDHALKIAAEARQAWLRETCGTGIDPK